jgi:fructokinase
VLGSLFVERLRHSGVDLRLSVPAREAATMAIASIGEDGGAGYDFYVSETADWRWRAEELKAAALHEAGCVHAGSLALVMEPGAGEIERALKAARPHATISIDPNVRSGIVDKQVYRAKAAGWAQLADIIRLSQEDLTDLVDLSDGRSLESVCDEWHAAGVGLIVITGAAASTVVSFQGSRIEIPVSVTTVVDTIGAGDAFNAGMLHWLHRNGSLGGRLDLLDLSTVKQAVSYGLAVAALSCEKAGANAPWASEVKALSAEARL